MQTIERRPRPGAAIIARWDRQYTLVAQGTASPERMRLALIHDIEFSTLERAVSAVFDRPKQLLIAIGELQSLFLGDTEETRLFLSRLVKTGWIEEFLTPPRFDRPVFIIAAPRSGSTALFEVSSHIPGIWSIGAESHDIFDGVLRHHFSNPSFDSIRATALDGTPERAARLVQLFSRRLRSSEGMPLIALSERDRPASLRMIDKLPKNSFRVSFLHRCFPDALFVFLYREPRGNISSIMEAWREGERTGRFVTYRQLPGTTFRNWSLVLPPGWRDYLDKPLEERAAFQWSASNTAAMDDLSQIRREQWHVISYAELTSNPMQTLQKLCEFVDLPFDHERMGLVDGKLKQSKTAVTPPDPNKWQSNQAEIERILPQTQAVFERLSSLGN